MLIFRDYKNIADEYKGSVLAIGNFDGIHIGHTYVLNDVKKEALKRNKKFAVLTFEPHPVKFLRPSYWNKKVLTFRTKIERLKKQDVEVIFSLRFNKNFSQLSAKNFIEMVLIKGLEVGHISVGADFKFGKNREGDVWLLKQYEKNGYFTLDIKLQKSLEGEICSSSIIRKMIKLGNIIRANKYLGFYWEVEGRVVHGEARGRQLGFPTANINYSDQVKPLKGIYAVWVKINNESLWRMGAASSGTRPQFGEGTEFLEVFIFKFNQDIYSKRIKVAFVKKIREEKVFKNTKDLINQMQIDCKTIEKELSNSLITC